MKYLITFVLGFLLSGIWLIKREVPLHIAALCRWKLNYLYGVLINAFILVADIIVQAIIFKRVNVRELTIDVLASFVFSIGVGYVFYVSECLLLTMHAPFMDIFATS